MKKTFLKLLFAVFVLLSISSCKKNSNSKSKTELLTQKAWIYSKLETGSGGNWQTDPGFATLEDCQKDDQTIFKTDKKYDVNGGASKCDPSEPQVSEQGTWDFEDNETKLIIDGQTTTIAQLDESTLVLTLTSAIENTPVNLRVTLIH